MYWLEVCNNEEVKRLNEVTIACFQDDIKLLVENKSDLPKHEDCSYSITKIFYDKCALGETSKSK
ncbi:hypothetical protein QTN94_19375 [Vibrio sp. M250220]|uniref:hypothetical protein n=1 Tax=Vibrio sp. M250220 TaxID=3020894 RepID=UPI002F418369